MGRTGIAGVLAVAAIGTAGCRSLGSPSPAAPAIDTSRSDQRGASGVTDGEGSDRALTRVVWPVAGQAAFIATGDGRVSAGPRQDPAPIASIAKVMTAYIVLRDHPLASAEDGPAITVTAADVADTDRRSRQQESIVPVEAGERLTERQALQALLLPSANNVAALLARWDAGSVEAFVARMNAAARALGMAHTRYTDPSGYDNATVSTAADQVLVVERAMSLPVFADVVATPTATLPVAGTVHTTDKLLGRDGFVGVKTGSDDAAGGCFAFRAIRLMDGRLTTITGVVLGQPGRDQIAAGLTAADALVDRIVGQPAASDPPAGAPAGRPAVWRHGEADDIAKPGERP